MTLKHNCTDRDKRECRRHSSTQTRTVTNAGWQINKLTLVSDIYETKFVITGINGERRKREKTFVPSLPEATGITSMKPEVYTCNIKHYGLLP